MLRFLNSQTPTQFIASTRQEFESGEKFPEALTAAQAARPRQSPADYYAQFDWEKGELYRQAQLPEPYQMIFQKSQKNENTITYEGILQEKNNNPNIDSTKKAYVKFLYNTETEELTLSAEYRENFPGQIISENRDKLHTSLFLAVNTLNNLSANQANIKKIRISQIQRLETLNAADYHLRNGASHISEAMGETSDTHRFAALIRMVTGKNLAAKPTVELQGSKAWNKHHPAQDQFIWNDMLETRIHYSMNAYLPQAVVDEIDGHPVARTEAVKEILEVSDPRHSQMISKFDDIAYHPVRLAVQYGVPSEGPQHINFDAVFKVKPTASFGGAKPTPQASAS